MKKKKEEEIKEASEENIDKELKNFYQKIRQKRTNLVIIIESLIELARKNENEPISKMEILGILEFIKLRYFYEKYK